MSEFSKRRLETAVVKANQLKATGAEIVATACHNCVDGLSDLIKHYKLNMKVKLVGELVADAMVFEKVVAVPVHKVPVATPTEKVILVVDDEPDVVTFLSTLLMDNGFKTLTAVSYEQAMEVLTLERPDLITLDLIMPGNNGLDLYYTLRTDNALKEIPVVFVTGVNPENPKQLDHRKFIYEHQLPKPDGFIEKPIDKGLLLMTIRKCLEQKIST